MSRCQAVFRSCAVAACSKLQGCSCRYGVTSLALSSPNPCGQPPPLCWAHLMGRTGSASCRSWRTSWRRWGPPTTRVTGCVRGWGR